MSDNHTPGYIISDDGSITLIWRGKCNVIGREHVNYDKIVAALKSGMYDDLDGLLDVPSLVERIDNVTVQNGEVFYGDERIGGVVANKIIQFIAEDLPYKPLARFLSKLMENPSSRSVDELYGFLAHQGMAITEDGDFLAYKGVRSDFKDKWSGTIDNSPGQKPAMARRKVDDDCRRTCSHGLHVGSHAYATKWAGSDGKVVLVKVNPANAVSVPADHNAEKLRVWTYEVLSEAPSKPLERPLYVGNDADTAFNEDEPEICHKCGNSEDDCYGCGYCGDCACDGECDEDY